ncbi:MAG: SMP-30/gluconolactonase/LRE family protein [Chthoniobacterales bacterium]|nr:SMP-30/gluconolactonase/LRE family protein [Chthoniobacterales bacterium]
MRSRFCLFLLVTFSVFASARGQSSLATLAKVASFPAQQVTGVAVSKTGRVFVNFPAWSDDHTISVAEIIDGKAFPYPNEKWNEAGSPNDHFVCVQSVYVDDTDSLWVLDPAAPKMQEIVRQGPKLVKIDLAENAVVQTIPFGEEIAPKHSYLNDVRIDTKTQTAYLTDSGLGAIVVVDLHSGKARRLLQGDHSTQAEKDFVLQVDGRKLLGENGKPPQIHADGIALDQPNGFLYFHALAGRTLYRIRTADLQNARLTRSELSAKVETVLETPPPDGMALAPNGKLFLTDVEHGAVVMFDPREKKLAPVITDGRLRWPDSLAWGPDGALYVTASQIQNMPRFNGGKDMRTTPYDVFKIVGALAEP